MKQIIFILLAVFALSVISERVTATPRLIKNTRDYIGVVADTSDVQASPGGSTYYATDELMFYVSNGVSWVVKSGSLGSTVVNVSAGGFVLADSLTVDYGIEELGTAWGDSAQMKPGGLAGSNLVNPLRIPTNSIYALNVNLGDSLRAKSAAFTSYLIANGATILRGGSATTGIALADTGRVTNFKAAGYGIFDGVLIARSGATITGSAAADTTKGTNAAFTGYGIIGGAGIFRGGTATTGIATADTVRATNSVTTGYGIINGVLIARTGATVTGTASATTLTATGVVNVGTHLKMFLNATLPDTAGFVGGETWYSAIGDTTYIYKSDHTIRTQP